MINQLEMPMYLQEALPEISSELKLDKTCNPFTLMHTLTEFTGENIKEHNYTVVKRCFKVADKLYSKGNGTVKNAVQNVFIYSLTNIFQTCKLEKSRVLAMLPISLYTLYLTQVYHSGC